MRLVAERNGSIEFLCCRSLSRGFNKTGSTHTKARYGYYDTAAIRKLRNCFSGILSASPIIVDLKYQRSVTGYHGCDESLLRNVLVRGKKLKHSENDYDWLGRGIYFWEHGPRRAYDWAQSSKRIKKPAVLAAIINLGNCFDLLDTAHTELLAQLFPLYRQACELTGAPLPVNQPPKRGNSDDHVMRHLDCAVINWSLDFFGKGGKAALSYGPMHFFRGFPVFEGSKILAKSHVQIAVRDDAAIVGYFKPQIDK